MEERLVLRKVWNLCSGENGSLGEKIGQVTSLATFLGTLSHLFTFFPTIQQVRIRNDTKCTHPNKTLYSLLKWCCDRVWGILIKSGLITNMCLFRGYRLGRHIHHRSFSFVLVLCYSFYYFLIICQPIVWTTYPFCFLVFIKKVLTCQILNVTCQEWLHAR